MSGANQFRSQRGMIYPTEKMKGLPQALLESNGIMGKAMLAVGYGKGYAKNPHILRASLGFKKVMEPFIKQLETARDKALKRSEDTVDEAGYADAITAVDKLTRNIQLLKGDPTDIVKNDYSNLTDEELTRIVNEGRGRASQEGTSAEEVA